MKFVEIMSETRKGKNFEISFILFVSNLKFYSTEASGRESYSHFLFKKCEMLFFN